MSYIIEIEPQATPRPKVSGRHVWYPSGYSEYKAALAWYIKSLRIQPDTFGEIDATFYFAYTKSTPKNDMINGKPHTRKPDADNLLKGLMDALEMSGALSNDSNLHAVISRKKYTTEKNGYIEFELTK